MKAIKLVLFIMTSIAAQEKRTYHVVLSSTIGQDNVDAGRLVLTQCGSEDPVRIQGKIEGLSFGWFSFKVHEINENTVNCLSLGPMVDLGFDPLFDLLDVYIDRSGSNNFTKFTRCLTLEPNKPRTLIGRAIAFFQEPILDFVASEHSYLHVICGSVLARSDLVQKGQYYREIIARDSKYNRSYIWY